MLFRSEGRQVLDVTGRDVAAFCDERLSGVTTYADTWRSELNRAVASKVTSKDTSKEIVAYAARAGLELGADAVKIKYTGDSVSFSWAVRAASGTKVFMSGGPKAPTEDDFLAQVRGVMEAGGTGVAVGRNVWQSPDPLRMAERLREVVFGTAKAGPA